MSEIPLDEQIRQNQIRNEKATYQRDQQVKQKKDEETQQAQAELDQYNKDVEQYNKDLEQYNRELAEIEKLETQQAEDPREKVNREYGEKIKALQDAKARELTRVHTAVFGSGGSGDRSEYNEAVNTISKNYDSAIEQVNRASLTEQSYYEYSKVYGTRPIERSVSNAFKSSGGQASLVKLTEQREANFEASKLAQSQRSAQTAQQEARSKKASYETGIKELKQIKRPEPTFIFNKEPTKANTSSPTTEPQQRQLTKPTQEIIPPDPRNQLIYNEQQRLKADLIKSTITQRPTQPTQQTRTILDKSNAFLTKPPPKVTSIIGTTQKRSEQAVFTFEETQKQQKELYQKLSQAKTTQEATKIKEEYQKLNPYVGTPQKAITKQGVFEQGTNIEKVLQSSKEDFEASLKPQKETTTQTEIITTKETETFGLKDSSGKPLTYTNSKGITTELKFQSRESAQKYIDRTSKTITTESQAPNYYGFIDPKTGKEIKPDSTILWQEANKLLETQVKPISKADTEFNQSLRESLKANPNQDIQIYKDTKTAEPLIQEPFVKGLTDLGTEFVVIGEDVIKLANPDYEKKIKQHDSSLETVAFTEGIEQGKYLLAIPGAEKPKESKTKQYVKEKLKTPEGTEYLAGSVIGSGALIIATGGTALLRQPLKAGVKEITVLKDIAENIFKPKVIDEYRTARLKELNPELTDYQIEKLSKTLYPTEKTPQEIKLTEMLKQNNPNLSQERIDFIISQTQKTDAIKLYQRQQALKEQLKKQYPTMSQKTIDQKVATMTAKESPDIPYSIEKINEKSYLISAGRETKDTNTPFIVVNFNKPRFGKEKGTYEIYESAKGTIKPTDLIIQGISKKELKGGQVISKTPSSTITRYPTGRGNIYKVLDPNQSDLALIGTVKSGKLAELKKYPKEVIESMVNDERKTAILETKHETELLAKMEKSARQSYDTSLKQTKTITKQTKSSIEIPSKSEITKQTNKINLQAPGNSTPQTISGSISKDFPSASNTEKLKDIARNLENQKATDKNTYQNIKSVSSLGISQAGIASIKLSTALAQKSETQQAQNINDIQIGQQRNLSIEIPSKSEITKQRDLITERNVIKDKITEKYKQVTTPRFSLITIPGLGEKTDQETKLEIITDLTTVQTTKELVIFKYPKPPEEPFLKTRFPGGIIIPDLTKKEKETKALEGKKSKTLYFSWNVNLEQPGRYLPTKDLVVGTNPKILKRTNKLQRQVSSGAYSKKQDKAITRSMDTSLTKSTQNRKTKSFMKKEKPFKFKIKF